MEIGDRLSAGKKLSAASQNDEGAAGRIGHFAWNAMRGMLAARVSTPLRRHARKLGKLDRVRSS